MSMGKRIKELRKAKGWNQTELGEKIGLSFGGISGIEADRRDTSQTVIIKLAETFNVSTDYILTGKESTGEISEDEREVLVAMREDTAFKEVAIEVAKAKKKGISYLKSYQARTKSTTEQWQAA